MTGLPTLSDSKVARLGAFAILYLAQGLPFGLFSVAIPSWMAANGFSAAEVGTFIGVVSLPWSLKIAVAPLMDRYRYPAMGQRRPWVLMAQLCLLLAFASFLFIPDALVPIAIVGTLCNTFAATQDVAVDGMAIGVLPDDERGTANGFMFGGQYLGLALGASGGGYAINALGLPGIGVMSVVTMALVLLVPMLLLERPGDAYLPGQLARRTLDTQEAPNSIANLFRFLLRAILNPISLFFIVVQIGYRAADGVLSALLPVELVTDLGWADTLYNDWYTIGSLIAVFAGVVLGPFLDRIGTARMFWGLWAFKFALIAGLPWFITAPQVVMQWVVALGNIASHLLSMCVIATIMRICIPSIAATHFAAHMAMSNLGFALGGFLYAAASQALSRNGEISIMIALMLMMLPAWALAHRRIVTHPHPHLQSSL